MAPVFVVVMQVMSFIADNKETLKQIVLNIESIIPEAAGNAKAAAVKNFIGTALNLETEIETAWPMVLPFFNLLVAGVKSAIRPMAAPL